MIREEETAPDFALPGVEAGDAVVLWFVPTPFLPTATAELRAIEAAGWPDLPGLRVWVLAMDSIYAAADYADRHGLSMAFLGDASSAAEYYGVRHDEWEGHYDVPKRAVFLVGTDWDVAFAWAGGNAFDTPDPSPVEAVGDAISALLPEARTDVSVDYAAFPR